MLLTACIGPIIRTPYTGTSTLPTPTDPSLVPTLAPGVPPTPPALTPTRATQWREDLAFLAGTLARFAWPTLSRAERAAFQQSVADLDAAIPQLSDQAIVVALMQRVAEYGGADVTLGWGEVPGFASVYPFRLTWFDDGLYVTETPSDRRYLLGMRLTHIDMVDIGTAQAKVATLIPGDDVFELYAKTPAYLVVPGVLRGLGLVSAPDPVPFVFEDAEGVSQTAYLSPVSRQGTWMSALDTMSPNGYLLPPVSPGHVAHTRAENYWFTYLQEEEVLYIRYNRCEALAGLPFDAFAADVFAVADSQPVSKFVIDLRANAGGDRDLIAPLIHGLWERPALNQGGTLFVLVGPGTLGAAEQVAYQVQKQTAATVLSEPTGHKLDRYGDSDVIHLPNSGLALWHMGEGVEAEVAPHLVPDLVVLPSSDAYFAGHDPLLVMILEGSPTLQAVTAGKTAPVVLPAREEDTTLSRSARWRADLRALVEVVSLLPELHEGGFGVVESEAFAQAVEELHAAIPTLEDHKVVVGMMRLLTMLGDAHTRISYWEWDAFQELAYPIQLTALSDGLYVTAAGPGYEDLLGMHLVGIADADMDEVMRAIGQILPHENEHALWAYSPDYLVRPVILQALGLAPDLQSARFVFQDTGAVAASGDIRARDLLAYPAAELDGVWVQALLPEDAPLYLKSPQSVYYWYTYIPRTRYDYSPHAQAVYVQYNVCLEMEDAPFEAFVADVIAQVEARDARLVIDLRRNEGGLSEAVLPLVVGLRQHRGAARPLIQQGRLFVLTGGRSFSSAVLLASLLRDQTGALLVGAPTGQGPNFYADFHSLALPYSGVVLHYPTQRILGAEEDEPTLEPDIPVPLDGEDYFAGRDPVLEAVLTYDHD